MSWTIAATTIPNMTASGVAIAKAGVNANSSVIASNGLLAEWSDEAEGVLCMKTRKDWVTNFADVGTTYKKALSDWVTNYIAEKIITYDMSGYLKGEATTMLNVLKDNSDTIIKDLREAQFQDKILE